MKFSEIIKHIGSIDLSSLESRIKYQKRMYFLEAFGVIEIGDYSWHIYGPYSTKSAAVGFDFVERDVDKEISVDKTKLDRFNHFNQKIGENVNFLELLASIHFLLFNKNLNKNEIKEKVSNKRNYLGTEKEFENAWNFLCKYFDIKC